MEQYGLRLSSITIDADGSPSGYVAWYNHSTNISRIRALRPSIRNDRYGVQRMEMLAVYFAIADNLRHISRIAQRRKKKRLVVNIRSDSKTSVEQLQGISEVRDSLTQRICAAIHKLLDRMSCMIVFNHLERTKNIAGLLLEQRRRKEEERRLVHLYEKTYLLSFVPGTGQPDGGQHFHRRGPPLPFVQLDEFCRRVADVDGNINTALVMKDITPEGAYARPGQWVPDRELLQRLLTQVNIMIGIADSNEQIYGEAGYVMVTHKVADFFFFPVAERRIFLVSVNRPYDHARLEGQLAEMLAELKKMV